MVGGEKAFGNSFGRGPRRGDESAATVLLVAGRSIMGLVPPFDRRNIETFEDGVPYITDLWIPADPLYTLRVQLVREFSFIQSKSDLFSP